jgi:hypothetical protein
MIYMIRVDECIHVLPLKFLPGKLLVFFEGSGAFDAELNTSGIFQHDRPSLFLLDQKLF